MTLPRRIQLVKLLKSQGLRSVERLREDEVKEALGLFRALRAVPVGIPEDASVSPSSAAFARVSDEPAPLADYDDPYALPRFREPKPSLPDHERTFLRAICVKPRLVFFTWDVARDRLEKHGGRARLELRFAEFLGDAPAHDAVVHGPARQTLDVDLRSGGWYVPVPGERIAITGTLVDDSGVIAESNASLAPPARPAPPGPLWLATLPPSLDRRKLLGKKLLRGEVADAQLVRKGETDARGLGVDDDMPASGALFRVLSTSASVSSSLSSTFGPKRGEP